MSNQYQIEKGMSSVDVFDYYKNEQRTLSLDPTLTPVENANKAYNKYNKKKRTEKAVTEQLTHTRNEIRYLESIQYTLDTVESSDEIDEVRKELMETGYIRFRKGDKRKKSKKSKPYHFVTEDGFHLYVGRNNHQNDELTLRFANNSDWWFHTKEVPGSHVIVKAEGKELPDHVFEIAGALAAYYSKARESSKVVVDYIQKKHIKKPGGSVPGYVIYHTNYSLYTKPGLDGLQQIID